MWHVLASVHHQLPALGQTGAWRPSPGRLQRCSILGHRRSPTRWMLHTSSPFLPSNSYCPGLLDATCRQSAPFARFAHELHDTRPQQHSRVEGRASWPSGFRGRSGIPNDTYPPGLGRCSFNSHRGLHSPNSPDCNVWTLIWEQLPGAERVNRAQE